MLTRARTVLALGLRNVARVAAYRALLRAGLHPVQRTVAEQLPEGPFFLPEVPAGDTPAGALAEPLRQFGWFDPRITGIPDWHASPLLGTRSTASGAPWWTVPDFDPALGDIKTVWEPSRLDWVITLAQRARRGEAGALPQLEAWLADWVRANPPYRGVNWKCGQEASLRLLHLAVAARILGQDPRMTPALRALLLAHLARIAPTMGYAMAQENNHGTSEAAALFVGGTWLEAAGDPSGVALARRGRVALEERVAHLFGPDGSFSQYSVNYHRLALDTCSVAELWRRARGAAPFSPRCTARLAAATEWLGTLVDPASGDAPNIGHNDGANLLRLTDAGYRDHRPAVELASALFLGRRWFAAEQPCGAHLAWLGVARPAERVPPPGSRRFDDGGTAVLRRGDAFAVLRYPRYRFRPAHADPLHVDLWVGGTACLRDGGTFSYAQEPEVGTALSGIGGHNTVQFDGREPMPRLGRFLWGDWLRTDRVTDLAESAEGTAIEAAYTDAAGAHHARRVVLGDGALDVRDTIGGFRSGAVLRWRLRPGAWTLVGDRLTDGAHELRIRVDGASARLAIVPGLESTHYLRRSALPVLEVSLDAPCTVESSYRWRA